MTCELCGGPIVNGPGKYGVCKRNPECAKEYGRRASKAAYDRNRGKRVAQSAASYERRMGDPAPPCFVCGGKMRRSAEFGVCKWTPECNRIQYLLRNARNRAAEYGVPFNLGARDIWPLPEYCPMLGTAFAPPGLGGVAPNSPSLDRLLPALGYVRGNVLVVSHRANRIKNDATADELMRVALFMMER